MNAHSGGYDITVIKLNSSGAYQWHTFYGSASSDYGRAVAVDGSKNLYVSAESDASWGGAPLNAHAGGYDIGVVKLNSSGAYQWHTFYGSASNDVGRGIATDGAGNVYVSGHSYATWGAPLKAYSGSSDIAVIKLNDSGAYQWHTFYGSTNADEASGLTVDGSGDVYLAGFSYGAWNGPGPTAPLNAYMAGADSLVLKLNSSGAYQWHSFYGSGSSDYGYGMAVYGGNYVYVGGSSYAAWNGPGAAAPLNAYSGSSDFYVVKIGPDSLILPDTGFAPYVVSDLPKQPAASAYASYGNLTLEIPKIGVETAIVGVSQSWDVRWLGSQAGWLPGTAFPTWAGNSALTGHLYTADGLPGPFIDLHNLRWGDEVVIRAWGQRHIYEVRQNYLVLLEDLNPLRHEEYDWVTLITCQTFDEASNGFAYRRGARAVLIKIEPE